MNIIDAIRTGKRFRRAGQSEWIPNADYHRFMLNRDEMLANDWLIEPDLPTFTRDECIDTLTRLRPVSRDLTTAMIDSLLFHLKVGE